LRFFAERRITTHFVDLIQRPASPGELRRFAQKFGVAALVNRESARFLDLGLGAARLSDDAWLEQLVAEPMILQMPLVRFGKEVSIGVCEEEWRKWLG
jgi:arsenate reductase-like glutaredoxin family protein